MINLYLENERKIVRNWLRISRRYFSKKNVSHKISIFFNYFVIFNLLINFRHFWLNFFSSFLFKLLFSHFSSRSSGATNFWMRKQISCIPIVLLGKSELFRKTLFRSKYCSFKWQNPEVNWLLLHFSLTCQVWGRSWGQFQRGYFPKQFFVAFSYLCWIFVIFGNFRIFRKMRIHHFLISLFKINQIWTQPRYWRLFIGL